MAEGYIVSMLLIGAVPRARRLEHVLVAARDVEDAERQARTSVSEHPDLRRFHVDLIKTSALPLGPALPPIPPSLPSLPPESVQQEES